MDEAVCQAVADWLSLLRDPHRLNVRRLCIVAERLAQVAELARTVTAAAAGPGTPCSIDVLLTGAEPPGASTCPSTDASGASAPAADVASAIQHTTSPNLFAQGVRIIPSLQLLLQQIDSSGYELIVAMCPNQLFFDAGADHNAFVSTLGALAARAASTPATTERDVAHTALICIEPRCSALTGLPALRARLQSSLASSSPMPQGVASAEGSGTGRGGTAILQALTHIATALGRRSVAYESAGLHSYVRLAIPLTGPEVGQDTPLGTQPKGFGIHVPSLSRQSSYGDEDLASLGHLLHVDLTSIALQDPTACADVRSMLRKQSLYNVVKAPAKRVKGRKGREAATAPAPPPGGSLPRPEHIELSLPLDVCIIPLGPVPTVAVSPFPEQGRWTRSLLKATCPAGIDPFTTRQDIARRGYTLAYALHAAERVPEDATAAAVPPLLPVPSNAFSGHTAALACWQELRAEWTRKAAGWVRPRESSKHRAAEGEAASSASGGQGVWFGASGTDFIPMGGPHTAAPAADDTDGSDDEYGGLTFDEVVEALVADGPGGIEDAPILPKPLPLRTVLDLFSDCWEETWHDFEEHEQEKEGKDEGWG